MGAALDARRAGVGIAAMVGCVVATAAAATAIVFGASLAELVDEPESYGWPWDVAVITGAGYGDTVIDVVDERLAQDDVRDDVVDHAFYSFDPSVVFGDRPAPVVFGWSRRHDTDAPGAGGSRARSAPARPLLGKDTAEALGLEIGDSVTDRVAPSSASSTSRWSASGCSRRSARSSPTAPGWAPAPSRSSTAEPERRSATASLTGIGLRDGADPDGGARPARARTCPAGARWASTR